MTKFSIKAFSGVLIALLLLSLIDRFSMSIGKLSITGIWMAKALNLSTSNVLPIRAIQSQNRIKIDSLITTHLQNNQSFYAPKIADMLSSNKTSSLAVNAALGTANAVKNNPQVAQQLAIIARNHPTLKVRCYWQAQLNQGTIISMVNSPGSGQVESHYLVLPEIHCPAKELNEQELNEPPR